MRHLLDGKHQLPWRVRRQRPHEVIRDQHREIEVAQCRSVPLGIDEALDVRMVAAQRPHHRPAAYPGREQCRAHAVPQAHEGHRPRGRTPDPLPAQTGGPQRGKVATHAPALLHGQRRIPQRLEDAGEVVRDRTHDEAVEQGQVPIHTGPGEDPPARQKPKPLQQVQIPRRPNLPLHRLDRRQCVRNPLPSRVDIGLAFDPIAGLPDKTRECRGPVVHILQRRETLGCGMPRSTAESGFKTDPRLAHRPGFD